MENDLVVYYHNDLDGFASAYVVWMKYRNHAEYIAINYNDSIDLDDVTNKDVIILDFSFNLETTKNIEAVSKSIIIIDHHITAYKQLGHLSYFNYYPSYSGATATWSYFNLTPPPLLLQYVEDMDLWKKQLPNSDELYYAIESYDRDFNIFHQFIKEGNAKVKQLISEGQIIKRYVDKEILRLIYHNTTEVNINNESITAINSPIWQSQIGNLLAQTGEYAVVYYDKDNSTVFSLRSKGDVDVSEIAKEFNGGGHKPAAGFSTECKRKKLFSSNVVEGAIEEGFKQIDDDCLVKYREGQFKYGPLDILNDTRNFKAEAIEEYEDLLNYLKVGLIKLNKLRRV